MSTKTFSAIALGLFAPAFALAQNSEPLSNLVGSFGGILTQLLPIVFTLALLAFFWGIIRFIWAIVNGQETDKTFLVWGIVALFILASIWGIVGYLQNIFDIEGGGSMEVPDVNTPFEE